MKKSASIHQYCAGGLIDEAALIDALRLGESPALDSTSSNNETEVTPVRKALETHPKVIVTPHTAWFSDERA